MRRCSMGAKLDMDKITKGLGAVERRGRVSSRSGYFGATQLAAEVKARFKTPASGGRATDPTWTERRQVPLTPKTLRRLETLASSVRQTTNVNVEPLQLAGMLLERATEEFRAEEAQDLPHWSSMTGSRR
jgi:hypothetical protein